MKPSEYLHENGVLCERNRILDMPGSPSESLILDMAKSLYRTAYNPNYGKPWGKLSEYSTHKYECLAVSALREVANHLRNIETTPRTEE